MADRAKTAPPARTITPNWLMASPVRVRALKRITAAPSTSVDGRSHPPKKPATLSTPPLTFPPSWLKAVRSVACHVKAMEPWVTARVPMKVRLDRPLKIPSMASWMGCMMPRDS